MSSTQRPRVPSVFPNELVHHDPGFVIVYDPKSANFVLCDREFLYPDATCTEVDGPNYHSEKLVDAAGEFVSECVEIVGNCQQITVTFMHEGVPHKATYVNGKLIEK
ncbi:hypothetical protein QKT49_gp036 [Acanthamoeba castellanii medusavirus]|uniref:Uncharacterized protein n=1 Tax=Acanthamoeba castellanii medusavirus J1 TaxID=3114988 RepID=A0A3T1CWG9_9VIRU|nr:hypothetical protein QKT49_gp036 [Acanthamoeba castellanii medusavirus]BBI30176.1 hypothetical protein [Acanthamoeba castellanii medusavirus J1]